MQYSSPVFIAVFASLTLVTLIMGTISLVNLRALRRLKTLFLAGKNGTDLETILYALVGQVRALEDRQVGDEQLLAELRREFNFAVQKIGVVRFNPFSDGGGNFSFSLALLDAQDSGVIITSMHGREQNRIYSKKIERGASESPLTEEEQQAVAMANNKGSKQKSKPEHH